MGRKAKRKRGTGTEPDPNIIPFADLLKPIAPMPQKEELVRQLRAYGGADPRTEKLIRKIESGEMGYPEKRT